MLQAIKALKVVAATVNQFETSQMSRSLLKVERRLEFTLAKRGVFVHLPDIIRPS
jgi:hypothetical protein